MTLKEDFKKLKSELLSHNTFHLNNKQMYDGDYSKSVEIDLFKGKKDLVKANLDWGKKAVDHLSSKLTWDAFKNDNMGLTKLMVDCGIDRIIDSAKNNAIRSACSFVAIWPGDTEAGEAPVVFTGYSGWEATGEFNSKTMELNKALAIHQTNKEGKAEKYLMFYPGEIYVLDKDGEVIDSITLNTNKILFEPFIFQQDIISKKFGYPRVGKGANEILNSALDVLLDIKVLNKNLVIPSYILLTNTEVNMINGATIKARQAAVSTIRTDGVNDRIEKIGGESTDELRKQLDMYTNQFASTMFMSPSSFGLEPANGSYSEGSLLEYNKTERELIRRTQMDFGNSIKRLAEKSYALIYGDTAEVGNVESVWLNDFNISNVGAFGDAISKLEEANIDIPSDFILRQLGIPLRTEAMNTDYTNISLSKEIQEKSKSIRDVVINDSDNFLNYRIIT